MKLDNLESLAILKNNTTEYSGNLKNYQQNGSKQKRVSQIDYEGYDFTPYQNILYKRALFGLTVYTAEELDKMHSEKKERIKKVNIKAQKTINLFKQEVVNQFCENIYLTLLSNSKLAKDCFSSEKVKLDPDFINILNLKSLGITKRHIANRLIKEGILPSNFYELKQAS